MFNALRKGFGLTAKTMFRPAVTTEYPDVKRPVQPRFHGRHVLNRHPDGLEKCVGCELCAWACPADAIYVQGRDNTPTERYSPAERYGAVYQINYLRCIFCGLCIEACPTRALTMSNEYELAGDSRQDLIFTKEQLLAPLPEGATPPPHTDAAVAARGIDYYGGEWGQKTLVHFPGKPVQQPDPGSLPLGLTDHPGAEPAEPGPAEAGPAEQGQPARQGQPAEGNDEEAS